MHRSNLSHLSMWVEQILRSRAVETRLQLCGEKRREPREASAHGLFQRELVRGWGGQGDIAAVRWGRRSSLFLVYIETRKARFLNYHMTLISSLTFAICHV